MATDLRRQLDEQVIELETRIAVLRRQLDARYEPDDGQSRETQRVEQRRAFGAAIEEEEARLRRQPAGRGRARRSRTWREEQLRTKVEALARALKTVPDDWSRFGREAVIRSWEEHLEELIDLLGNGGE